MASLSELQTYVSTRNPVQAIPATTTAIITAATGPLIFNYHLFPF